MIQREGKLFSGVLFRQDQGMILPTAPNISPNGQRSGERITYADVANHA